MPYGKVYTYIQDSLTPEQRKRVLDHMDYLGFDTTKDPEVFGSEKAVWPMVAAYTDVLGGTSILPMHSHSFMEVFQYISAHEVEYLIGTHRYRVRQGDFVCVPPGTFHQVLKVWPEDTACVRHLMTVSPIFLSNFGWKQDANQFFVFRITDEKKSYLSELFTICVEESKAREENWQNMLQGYASILLTQILRSSENRVAAEKDGLFEKMLTYIDDNLHQRLTLSETARRFYISERTVSREFQKNLGISFYRLVIQRRLMRARQLLHGDLPLEEVAEAVGFTDYPSFYRAFKKEFGVSPRQLKALQQLPMT